MLNTRTLTLAARLLTVAAVAGAPLAAAHAADDWPGDSLDLVIPTRAGGGLDTTFRQIQPFLEEALGVPVAVDYRAGGQFTIGTTYVARNGDSCEPMMFHAIPDIIFSYLTRKVAYSYDDFYPVAGMTTEPSTLWVSKDAPWQTLQEFVDDARKRPGEIRVSVANLTNADHLAVLKLEEVAGIDLNIISYDGGGKARNAVVAGEVEGAMGGVFAGQKIADRARALGVFQPQNRWPELTNGAPAVNEVLGSDIPPIGGAFGFFVTRACHDQHPQRFEKLASALRTAATSEGFAKKLDELGERSKLRYETPEEFDAFIRREIDAIKRQIDENPALFGL